MPQHAFLSNEASMGASIDDLRNVLIFVFMALAFYKKDDQLYYRTDP